MPLIKRQVDPTHLSRGVVSDRITNELECVTNNTLAGVIKQLSSLSKHAEDLFGELYSEANTLFVRTNSLQDRIDRLSHKVTQLDSTVDVVSLQDINMRKAFKSSVHADQQVVSRSSLPAAMSEIYSLCDKPPALNDLSKYRDDGKEGLKFYTDPTYFFELWRQEEMKQQKEVLQKKEAKKKKQRRPEPDRGNPIRRPKQVDYNVYKHGPELVPSSTPSVSSGSASRPTSIDVSESGSGQDSYGPNLGYEEHNSDYRDSLLNRQLSRTSQMRPAAPPPPPPGPTNNNIQGPPLPPPPPPYPGQQNHVDHDHIINTFPGGMNDDLPPPPPPQPSGPMSSVPPPPAPPPDIRPMGTSAPNSSVPPPPPLPQDGILKGSVPPAPPPPPPGGIKAGVTSPGPMSPSKQALKKPEPEPEPEEDGRSDLLQAIRKGIQLRKVQVQEENDRKQSVQANSVEAILARRIAMEISSDESDGSDFDEDWD
ncbi:actin-binding protein WASF3-like [Glandiceps talaboti]